MDKKYYIFVGDEKIEVDQEVYKSYWQITNRERYLERLDRQNKLLFFSDLSTEYSFEDTIADENYDLEKIVETKMLIDKVREAIDSLNDEEREVIERLYYQDESLRSIATSKKISAPALLKRRNKILKKLKELLNDLM
ncbi:sigma factor-like helix-turn-helix DNA-binding protein [Parvimonas micra]|uniref:sigma factor-like helix-turn-helix DNA-binding protein n=1 Tax=Parvimonas micra TaxID=33033 RepID=UPI00248EEA3A|nr:sigma factor-like helix-turn-helix DNA-binding protein [Parvimonas micra]